MPLSIACPVCDAGMHHWRHDWCFACSACGFLSSSLSAHIVDRRHAAILDEDRRTLALADLRQKNFEFILDRLDSIGGESMRSLLEVGCAHGWFLDAAARRGYRVHGIEPDAPIGTIASSKGHVVTIGFFPEALSSAQRFQIIAFNDVFEHLADPRAALAACHQRLEPGGLLVLNLPSSHGTFFRIAAGLDRFGFSGPLKRLWQKDFPSPHVSYFHPAALTRLAAREGFSEVYRGRLVSLDRRGLWRRMRLDRRVSLAGAAIAWLACMSASPFLARLPSDITLQIYQSIDRRPKGGR